MKRSSIPVVSWNGREHLALCLPTLLAQRVPGLEVEILVLDNGSSDGSVELVRNEYPSVRLVESAKNLGFAAANNRLAELATGEALVLVNNDVRAEPGWLAALVDAWRAAPADVAAVAGRIVDWEGDRLDFGHGIATFDGHALALDQGRPVGVARVPSPGEELLFGCGGNLLVKRAAFLDAGGFDERYFSYFEDVDLGWRLWAGGERVIACPGATLRHRLSATSERLGNSRRGSLFERNALWTVVKNLEDGLRERLLPAILLTFLARLDAMLGAESGGVATAGADAPARPESRSAPLRQRETLRQKYRRFGLRDLVRRGSARALRDTANWIVPPATARPDRIEVTSDRSLAQIRALSLFLSGLDAIEGERSRLALRRRRTDRELFERFPLWVVPTYPGDDRLFASSAFASWLPSELRFERASLDEVVAP
jgi:GT2 family glycosyltransferase